MTDELRPCPFCPDGGKPYIVDYFISGAANHLNHFAKCGLCCIRTRSRKTINGAIKDWNTRPLEDAIRATIKEQGELIEKLGKQLKEIEPQIKLAGDNISTGKDWYIPNFFYLYDCTEKAITAYHQWKETQK